MATKTIAPTAEADGTFGTSLDDALLGNGLVTVLLAGSDNPELFHFTTPGQGKKFQVGPGGLRLRAVPNSSVAPPIIKRPADPPIVTDDNYGLFFEPQPPTSEEIAAATWKLFTPPDPDKPPFEFDVIMRGSVSVRGIVFDCNMQNQEGIEDFNDTQIDQSAMLSFAGMTAKNVGENADGVARRIYVGFNSVTVRDCVLLNGGYTPDLSIPHADFYPHIDRVTLRDITSQRFKDHKRAAVELSGYPRHVTMRDLNVESIRAEVGANLRNRPRKDDEFVRSEWQINHVIAPKCNFSAGGDVFELNGQNLQCDISFKIPKDGRGTIRNSRLAVAPGNDNKFSRMHDFLFRNVEWHLKPNDMNIVNGIVPIGSPGCTIRFEENSFVIDGDTPGPTGQLFGTQSFNESAGSSMDIRFRNCVFPDQFGHPGEPPIARINAIGVWRFRKADLGDRPAESAIIVNESNGQLTESGAQVVATINAPP